MHFNVNEYRGIALGPACMLRGRPLMSIFSGAYRRAAAPKSEMGGQRVARRQRNSPEISGRNAWRHQSTASPSRKRIISLSRSSPSYIYNNAEIERREENVARRYVISGERREADSGNKTCRHCVLTRSSLMVGGISEKRIGGARARRRRRPETLS